MPTCLFGVWFGGMTPCHVPRNKTSINWRVMGELVYSHILFCMMLLTPSNINIRPGPVFWGVGRVSGDVDNRRKTKILVNWTLLFFFDRRDVHVIWRRGMPVC